MVRKLQEQTKQERREVSKGEIQEISGTTVVIKGHEQLNQVRASAMVLPVSEQMRLRDLDQEVEQVIEEDIR